MGNRRHERIPAMDYRQYRRARRLVRECCNKRRKAQGLQDRYLYDYKQLMERSLSLRIFRLPQAVLNIYHT
ncbi:hypothetical protein D5282_22350 [bacterium 1xD8-48]|nr:hypothetical protein [bacterium 1xD8-48]